MDNTVVSLTLARAQCASGRRNADSANEDYYSCACARARKINASAYNQKPTDAQRVLLWDLQVCSMLLCSVRSYTFSCHIQYIAPRRWIGFHCSSVSNSGYLHSLQQTTKIFQMQVCSCYNIIASLLV